MIEIKLKKVEEYYNESFIFEASHKFSSDIVSAVYTFKIEDMAKHWTRTGKWGWYPW